MLTYNEANIVVLSDGNNPRILNPDFLSRNEIIPAGWAVSEVIVTPPLSLVRYAEGYLIQMEENKVTFGVREPSEVQGWEAVLSRIANRFLEVLPHVSYRAVGVNLEIESDSIAGRDAEHALMDALLSHGDWRTFMSGMTGSVIEYQFRDQQPNLNIKISISEQKTPEGVQLFGPMAKANFHHTFQPEETEQRERFIEGIEDCKSSLLQFVRLIPIFQ